MTAPWLTLIADRFARQKAMAEKALQQLSDSEFRERPAPGFNSAAIIVRHVAGNLSSRFTDFLTTDGEKPWRNRDGEFTDWTGSRAELMTLWNAGWQALFDALAGLDENDATRLVTVRNEDMTVAAALLRSLDHIAGHVGQLTYLCRLVHEGTWNWLTIPPGGSEEFNRKMGV